MMMFGSLDDMLKRTTHGRELLNSPGPVADAFVRSNDPFALLNGPRGSAKTTTVFRKMCYEATCMQPFPLGHPKAGVRRYVPQVMRPKYKNLWGTTIKSWWKLFPTEAFPDWTGANGRDADHIIQWQDAFGLVEMHVLFRAFAEGSEEDDARGSECTDGVLEETDTHDEQVPTNITGSLARDPVRSLMNRDGKLYGSLNAPDVMNWTYRDFWQHPPKPGCVLYRQPGGLDAGAENLHIVTRAYYENMERMNGHRPWWVRKLVHNRPGFVRDMDVILPDFDEATMVAQDELSAWREIPVVIGFDGGSTPAAAFLQMPPDGQLRILAEVALNRGDEGDLADACLSIMAQKRFAGCEFIGCCDPAMTAGEDNGEGRAVSGGSMRQRLAKLLAITIHPCATNDPETRHGFLRAFTRRNKPGRPGILMDPSCQKLRRGFVQTFHYRRIHGTDDRGGVVKNPDSHVCEAAEYGASLSGEAVATRRRSEREADRRRRQQQDQAGAARRYNPVTRRVA